MIQVIEVISAVTVTIASFGLIVSAWFLYFFTHKRCAFLLALGLSIAEVGRLFRILGISYLTEPRDGAIRLVDDATVGVFLAQHLLMPTGLLLAMAGLGVFALSMRRQGRSADR